MGEGEPSAWTGRREANRALAWAIIAIGTGLLLTSLYQVVVLEWSFNIWFFTMVILAMLAYAAFSFTSSVEMVVELADEKLLFTKREEAMGKVIKERTVSVERSMMSKVVERNAGFGIRVVKIEDAKGRRLLIFPEFLGPEEHDQMIAAIIVWGNQPSSSPGPEDLPLADSR